MSAKILDGRKAAENLRREIAREVTALSSKHDIIPGLAVVLLGNDPASEIYVRSKVRETVAVGMRSFSHQLSSSTSMEELLTLIRKLNAAPEVDGILIQLPLPSHLDAHQVIETIHPAKDVDGFHPVNAGRVTKNLGGMIPCTPLGCLMLIKSVHDDLSGLDALIIGCSNIVGKPMAQLLLAEECTVTLAHKSTRNLPDLCRRADLVVVAVGQAGLIRGEWIKPGATVIDVGINRLPGAPGAKARVVGDVAFDEAKRVAGAVTPVPGGVGPMTIACLLQNTLRAAQTCRIPRSAKLEKMSVAPGR
jgi:methylenetetrahydrofolate dehydrogenase (NADP+)/methenyltetrahydrofolate cyclohydrolase